VRILGISAFYHDSAAALIIDGAIVAAAQEERFSRIRHDAAFPAQAMAYCLEAGGIAADALDAVVFYEKPFLKFDRLIKSYLGIAPRGFESFCTALPVWVRDKLFQKRFLVRQMRALSPNIDWAKRIMFSEHHLSHAASAFYPSPFDQALVLTLDGVGEWTTTSAAVGRGNRLDIIKEIRFPHSLGLLYSAFTSYTGFRVNSGEYKMMGLAPYGEPRYRQQILDHLIDLKADGSFRLNQDYFDYCAGISMTSDRFDALFGGPARQPEELLTQRHMDLAASAQSVIEEAVLRLTRALAAETGQRNLCLAGGVALNCVANGKILQAGNFDRVWVQPAAGDAGGALGAALSAYHLYKGMPRPSQAADSMRGSYLGPAYSDDEIARRLNACGAVLHTQDQDTLLARVVKLLCEGKAVGWFQGRMEFGPRALGARSILGDPRNPDMQRTLNLKVKYRESFRPFAPAVLREDVGEWFDFDEDSPYMLMVGGVHPKRRHAMTQQQDTLFGIDKLNVIRSDIPAVTHVDYSARVQTVHAETNPRFHALLQRFKSDTGCPVLVNTSFNVRGEPIVNTPEDAFRCFMGTGIEALAIGNHLLLKDEQSAELMQDYREQFHPD
jgi:carbamoyltransferase